MDYLTHLLYVSRATTPIWADELNALAAGCAARNRSGSVTGILLYGSGTFLQLLEGRAAPLDGLWKRILGDPRHTDIQVLLRAPAHERLFPRWYMGALNLDLACTQVDRDRLADALRDGPGRPPSSERVLAVLRDFRRQLPAPDVAVGI